MSAANAIAVTGAFRFEGELQRFFRSRESELGIASSFGAMVTAAMGGGGRAEHDHDGRIVNLLDRLLGKTDGERSYHGHDSTFRHVWRALQSMDQAHLSNLVVVLHLLYGHTREPDFPGGVFGDVAKIVHLTDAAESAREDFSAEEGSQSMLRLHVAFDLQSLAARRDIIAESFWRVAATHARRARGAARLSKRHQDGLEPIASVHDAVQKRDASWRLLGVLLDEYDREPKTRALHGACTHADRAWSSRDAVKARLEYNGPRDERGKPKATTYATWARERDEWVRTAKVEAERLRAHALTEYAHARSQVAQ